MTFKSGISIAALAMMLSLPGLAAAQDTPTANTVVATVNGTEITLGHMLVMRQRLPDQYQQLPPEVLFNGILDQLVQQTLLGEQIAELSTESQMVLDNENRALKAAQELRSVIGAAMTDEAMQAAYDEIYGNAEPESEYNASHILVETEEEAAALVTDLEGGADFAELAKEKSTGPSGPRGGELGWFGAGMMVAPFEEAVVALEIGSISAPVQTQFGWHVIKLNDTRVKDAPSIEEVRNELGEKIQSEAVSARIEELTEGADVTRVSNDEIDPTVLNDMSLLEN
ncbi:MAG: peptidylprolyl isomerase [Silicimonas sp.]|jgi:peptidyl-prolyl cis-trans isomerase C|nr:peptidylprolyl isomerase [Silicimonas sp.]